MNKPLPGAGFPPSGPNSVSTRQSRPPFPLDFFPHREYNELQSQIKYERHDTSKVYADTIRYGVDCRRRFLGHIATAYALLYLPPKVLNRTLRRTRPALRPRSPSCSSAAAAQKASSGRPGYFRGNAGAKKNNRLFFQPCNKSAFCHIM